MIGFEAVSGPVLGVSGLVLLHLSLDPLLFQLNSSCIATFVRDPPGQCYLSFEDENGVVFHGILASGH